MTSRRQHALPLHRSAQRRRLRSVSTAVVKVDPAVKFAQCLLRRERPRRQVVLGAAHAAVVLACRSAILSRMHAIYVIYITIKINNSCPLATAAAYDD